MAADLIRINLKDYNLPEKFIKFRPWQHRAITDWVSHRGRGLIQEIPTGVGKSFIYVMGSLYQHRRTVVLTATKALQTQLLRDFSSVGMVEIKGRQNYKCIIEDTTADKALCTVGKACSYRDSLCPYYDALKSAVRAQLVVTNYAYWLTGDLQADILVMDEAHESPECVSNAVSVNLDLDEMSRLIGDEIRTPRSDWCGWTRHIMARVQPLIEAGMFGDDMTRRRLHGLIGLQRTIESLYQISTMRKVVQINGKKIQIDPLELNRFTDRLLKGIDRVLMTSATVTPKTADILGIAGFKHRAYPSPFPVKNRPVVYITQAPRVDRHIEPDDERAWMRLIDGIIRDRLDRKGIIHSVSYARAHRIRELSAYKTVMRTHTSRGNSKAARLFANSDPPSVLVSPSQTTGVDYPYTQCEYQVIAKVPFPDSSDKTLIERSKLDNELAYYLTWQEIIQASGRGVRAADDRCQTIITDSHFGWFFRKHQHLAPKWFLAAVQPSVTLPRPLEKL